MVVPAGASVVRGAARVDTLPLGFILGVARGGLGITDHLGLGGVLGVFGVIPGGTLRGVVADGMVHAVVHRVSVPVEVRMLGAVAIIVGRRGSALARDRHTLLVTGLLVLDLTLNGLEGLLVLLALNIGLVLINVGVLVGVLIGDVLVLLVGVVRDGLVGGGGGGVVLGVLGGGGGVAGVLLVLVVVVRLLVGGLLLLGILLGLGVGCGVGRGLSLILGLGGLVLGSDLGVLVLGSLVGGGVVRDGLLTCGSGIGTRLLGLLLAGSDGVVVSLVLRVAGSGGVMGVLVVLGASLGISLLLLGTGLVVGMRLGGVGVGSGTSIGGVLRGGGGGVVVGLHVLGGSSSVLRLHGSGIVGSLGGGVGLGFGGLLSVGGGGSLGGGIGGLLLGGLDGGGGLEKLVMVVPAGASVVRGAARLHSVGG